MQLGPFLLALAACGGESTAVETVASGGTAGSGVGGSGASGAGAGGTSGTGGSGGEPDCTPMKCASIDACAPVTPSSELITDFSNLDNGIFHAPTGAWWLEFFGGSYVYPVVDACAAEVPPTVLSQDLSAESLHVTGTVGTWSGFGLWFSPCIVDMSAYSGVSFTISGDAGPNGPMRFYVLTASNMVPSTDPRNPTCSPNVATCVPEDPEMPAESCRAGLSLISDVREPRTVTVPFSDVTGGSPDDTPDPAEVIGFLFEFDWQPGWTAADEYGVDVALDDVILVPR